jgi:hypothetical protein
MTGVTACHFERSEKSCSLGKKYLDCVNVGVPACEKPLIDWVLARKITRLSSYEKSANLTRAKYTYQGAESNKKAYSFEQAFCLR